MLTRSTMQHAIKGGMELHGELLSEGLVKNGHKLTIITTKHPHEIEYKSINGVEIYFLKNTVPQAYSNEWWRQSVYKFDELHKKVDFDLVWSQSWAARSCLKKIKQKYKLPVVAILHGTAINGIKNRINSITNIRTFLRFIRYSYKPIHRYLFIDFPIIRSVDTIISVGKELTKEIKRHYFRRLKSVYTVPNGIDISKFNSSNFNDNIRKRYRIEKDSKLILTVSRMSRDKGIHILLHSLSFVKKKFPDTKLLIVGNGSIYLEKLKKLANNLNISESVIFTGYIPNNELPDYYNACDLFIMPTLNEEAFGLTLVEAMACKKVVIVSDVSGSRSIIENGVNGILSPKGNVYALSGNIITILHDQKLAEKISINAQRDVIEKFSVKQMVQDTIEVFERVSSRHVKTRLKK